MRQPGRDQISATSRAQRIADWDECAEHDEDRPFNRIVGLAQTERPREQQNDRGPEKKATATGATLNATSAIAAARALTRPSSRWSLNPINAAAGSLAFPAAQTEQR